MEQPTKTPAQSYTEQIQIVLLAHANGTGRLFGGQLMSWMDVTGAVAARRHAEREVVTASVDSISFVTPAFPSDLIVIEARLKKVGHSSMHVLVTASVETLGGQRMTICTSTFVFVAVDGDGKPTQVPRLVIQDQAVN